MSAPMAVCPRDGEPLVGSLEVAYKEWLCMVCGDRLEYFGPSAVEATSELSARYEVLRQQYRDGTRPAVTS